MIFAYNRDGLQNTLLVIINPVQNDENVRYEKNGDITIIHQEQTREILGYNISQASEKFDISFSGILLENDEKLKQQVIDFLEENQIQISENVNECQQDFRIGHVVKCEKHPDSEKLSVCKLNIGEKEAIQVVCGAKNIAEGQFVVVAMIGSVMPNGLAILPGILRKIASNGMICSASELNLPHQYQSEGILILSEHAPVGQNFFAYYNEEMK